MLRNDLPVCAPDMTLPLLACMYACLIYIPWADVTCKVDYVCALAFYV